MSSTLSKEELSSVHRGGARVRLVRRGVRREVVNNVNRRVVVRQCNLLSRYSR
jgi:hypothetical protein